jgi:hypothetical protein
MPESHTSSQITLINDVRRQEDFAGVSFSIFKRTQVKKSLLDAVIRCNVEESNYWTAELACCGCFLELWELFLEIIGKHIYSSNVKLPILIAKRFSDFKAIAMGEYSQNPLGMRNCSRIRRIFSEIITILTLSRKKNKLQYVKINEVEDFDLHNLSQKMKAPNTDFASKVIDAADPTEVFIAVNELGYNVSRHVKNSFSAHYWIEWILAYEKKCRKKKERCECKRRDFAPQEDAHGKDISFLVWDLILKESKRRGDKALDLILYKILELYKIKFSSGSKRKRKHLLYFAVLLLCEPYDISVNPISDEEAVKAAVKNVDLVYQQVKQSEVVSKSGLKSSEKEEKLSKSEAKMKILQTMGM